MVGLVLGAAIGSKFLYWLEDPGATVHHLTDPTYLLAGKTIVGGILGSLIGVELTKKLVKWPFSTGDNFVFPLIAGIVIGRIGCFLTGLSDHTYGIETNWITGVNFGDGVYRHPTQLYEIAYVTLLGGILYLNRQKIQQMNGLLFQCFAAGYLLFRFCIEFIKPFPHAYFIFNAIQLACAVGLYYYGRKMYVTLKKMEVVHA